jgi:DHA2 family multidrug resistance protein
LVPLWLQTSMGYTATSAGYTASLNGILAVVMSPIVAGLVRKIDPRRMVSFGVLWMAAIAFWRSHFTTQAGFWDVALTFLAQGFAMPFFFVAGTSIVLSSVDPQETASASGLSNFLRTTSAAFATSIITTAWDNSTQEKRSHLASIMDPTPTISSLGAAGIPQEQAVGTIDRLVQQQAIMLATDRMFTITIVIFILAAISIWFAPRPTRFPGMGGPPKGDH